MKSALDFCRYWTAYYGVQELMVHLILGGVNRYLLSFAFTHGLFWFFGVMVTGCINTHVLQVLFV